MRKSFKTLAVVAATVFAVSACGGDGSGPSGGGELSKSEAQALATALTTSGAMGSSGAAFAPFVFTQLRQTGTMSVSAAAQAAAGISNQVSLALRSGAGDMQAVGVQVKFSYSSGGSVVTSGVYTSVIGWDGLNTSSNPPTVDHLVSADIVQEGGTEFQGAGTVDLSEGGMGSYYDRATGSSYFSNGGSMTLSSVSFSGGTTDCGASQQGVTVECSYTKGSMKGSFNFTADKLEGSGPDSYTQPTTSFDVPALRFTLNMAQ
ncbi:MAG TPA: hypothetical protein VFS40_11905 [Gemmatimonadales bacterium]|nr:hypothetical protein [Gemmatimonadales bacterium]